MRNVLALTAFTLGVTISYPGTAGSPVNSSVELMLHSFNSTSVPLRMASCLPAYDDCMNRAGPYCQNETANDSDVNRAVDYAACLSIYQNTCRSSYCD
jgi:hypothetical protein